MSCTNHKFILYTNNRKAEDISQNLYNNYFTIIQQCGTSCNQERREIGT